LDRRIDTSLSREGVKGFVGAIAGAHDDLPGGVRRARRLKPKDAVERLVQLSLRAAKSPATDASFRALMRNGDSLLVAGGFGPLRLRVGDRPTEVDAKQIERVEFTEAGDKATAVLRNGDSLTGELTGGRIELTLAVGPRLPVHPSAIRTLVRAASRPTIAGGG